MSQSIEVKVEYQKKYSVHVGMDLWDSFRGFCSQRYSSGKAYIIIDARVNRLHGQKVLAECAEYFDECIPIEVPEGEPSKSMNGWAELVDMVLEQGAERTTPVVAVGGGVTGDLAGFTAASVLRGIPLIHIPTSLLAMVDSSIGGKTGINHRTGKNLIGAFYQPDAVFADIRFLETLDDREWVNGLSEVLKYAAIRDPEIFARVEQLIGQGFVPSTEWGDLVADSARIKADIVQEDTLEAGKRAFLNFGHTFAHALEKSAGYGVISHGEAVFIGMLAACYVSRHNGAAIDCARFTPFIPLYNIDLEHSSVDTEKLIDLMARDKKVQDNIIRLVLLETWGSPVLVKCNDMKLLKDAWKFALDQIKQ